MNKHLFNKFMEKAGSMGVDFKTILIDEIQSFFLENFYKNPASCGVVLFGGGRFRHINHSIRFSIDLDFFNSVGFNYDNVLGFISGKFIGLLTREYGVSARVIDIPPWEKIHNVNIIRLLVYDEDRDFYQVEIDFDFMTRQPYSRPEKTLLKNVVISVGSAEELLEEKLVSVYERTLLKARDIFDLWWYRDLAKELNKRNIRQKISQRGVTADSINKRLDDFTRNRDYYLKEIENIIRSCGERREEVKNLLTLDLGIILDHVIAMTRKYMLDRAEDENS